MEFTIFEWARWNHRPSSHSAEQQELLGARWRASSDCRCSQSRGRETRGYSCRVLSPLVRTEPREAPWARPHNCRAIRRVSCGLRHCTRTGRASLTGSPSSDSPRHRRVAAFHCTSPWTPPLIPLLDQLVSPPKASECVFMQFRMFISH